MAVPSRWTAIGSQPTTTTPGRDYADLVRRAIERHRAHKAVGNDAEAAQALAWARVALEQHLAELRQEPAA